MNDPPKGEMTMWEAGRKGGLTTSGRYGPAHYERIGKAGARRVQELLRKGREKERDEPSTGG